MGRFLLRRGVDAACVCLCVSFAAFALVHVGGDVAIALGGMEASPEDLVRIRAYYGFDEGVVSQYLGWAGHVLRGDLGRSFFSRESVAVMILDRLPVTLALASCALLLGVIAGVPLGVAAAIWSGRWPDGVCMALTTLAQAMPAYWTGLLLIMLFGVRLQVLPISGTEEWRSYVMPVLALGWFVMPVLARLTRAGMIEVLSADFIRAARAKGLRPHQVFVKHALRNAILPVVSVGMVQFGYLLGGSIVVESVFALNGIGLLAWSAILRSDFPVVQGIVVIVAVVFLVLTFLADAINGLLDPRLRR